MPLVGSVDHKELGKVMVTSRLNSRLASARWRRGLVNLNVPAGTPLADINRILDDFTPRLLAVRPDITFSPGQTLVLPDVEITIRTQPFLPDKILTRASLPASYIEVGTNLSFDSRETSRLINDMLLKVARKIAPQALLPHARRLAAKIGHMPTGWHVSTGHRVLGVCNARGIISLSYVLVFLPAHLRDYVIYHELAHLLEMNHSGRFHALLNSYLDGREAELVAELRNYRWPIMRN